MNVHRTRRIAGPLLLMAGLLAAPASAQLNPPLKLVPFVSGLSAPTGMVQDPTDPNVQYVLQKGGSSGIATGKIRVVQNGVLLPDSFLELSVMTDSECGVTGMAFAPDYATSRRFFVFHCLPQGKGDTTISRFRRDPSNRFAVEAGSRLDFQWNPGSPDGDERYITQPQSNHKGGKLIFGPDGYLYASVGDGGSNQDDEQHAQNMFDLRGKVLRLDVNVPDSDTRGYTTPADNPFGPGKAINGRPEIWQLGLRNPWRISFDNPALGGSGALLIADVGETRYEEVNYVPPAVSGRNFGWPLREGKHDFLPETRTQAPVPMTDPFYEYDHDYGHSITGGWIYRGTALGPAYQGRYFFADFVTKKIVSLGLTINPTTHEAMMADLIEHTSTGEISPSLGMYTSIDVDSKGELYFVSYDGNIYKLVPDYEKDSNSNGLPDYFEAAFGVTDPGSDPDADGKTNLQEFQDGTHPNNKPAYTRYFAEGANSSFFSTAIAIANPGATAANVNLRYLRDDGVIGAFPVKVGPQRRVTVLPSTLPNFSAAAFSTIIESDQEIVAERTMVWPADVRYGSHSETAVKAPAPTWYLGEGSTLGQFDLYYLIENPNAAPVNVTITYLRLAPAAPITKTYTVAAFSRKTITVQDEAPELFDADVSAIIKSTDGTTGIIVERAMYLSAPGQLWRAGTDAAGVTALNTHWFFAEGATGSFFDMFLLMANPGATEANVTLTFLRPNGLSPITITDKVPANSRVTKNVETLDPALKNEAMSTIVTSDQPIVAERAMYWPGLESGPWQEGHVTPGATETGQAWVVADGELGGNYHTETFVLIANTSAFVGRARVTLLMEDGTTVAPREIELPANSRVNAPDFFDVAANKRFSVLVESILAPGGASTAEIVVERATYSNDSTGVLWSAGSAALGTKLR
jgi:glucose/arabinose dehydrogenase